MIDGDELRQATKRLDPALQSLYVSLSSGGWRVVATLLPRSRSEGELTMELDGLRVKLAREKGESAIEIGATTWTATYGITTWHQMLDGRPVDPFMSARAQADLLVSDLPRIRGAIASAAAGQDLLRATAADQVSRAYRR